LTWYEWVSVFVLFALHGRALRKLTERVKKLEDGAP